MTHAELVHMLFENQDLKYRDFHSALVPGIPVDTFVGVRIPVLRKLARDFSKTTPAAGHDVTCFMDSLPHRYFEENQVHLMLIQQMKNLDECLARLEQFLPYVNNWSVCDGKTPRIFASSEENVKRSLNAVRAWLKSDYPYMVRFGVNVLMDLFPDDRFEPKFLKWVASIDAEKHWNAPQGIPLVNPEYYVQMEVAWYFATALAKQWDRAFPYIENRKLAPWIHNKTIQKSMESYRISAERKEALQKLKVQQAAKTTKTRNVNHLEL